MLFELESGKRFGVSNVRLAHLGDSPSCLIKMADFHFEIGVRRYVLSLEAPEGAWRAAYVMHEESVDSPDCLCCDDGEATMCDAFEPHLARLAAFLASQPPVRLKAARLKPRNF